MKMIKNTLEFVPYVLLAGLIVALLPFSAFAGGPKPPGCAVGTPTNPSYTTSQKPSTSVANTYQTIIDHTQAEHANVIVSNTETETSKSYPLTGASVNPWAAMSHDIIKESYNAYIDIYDDIRAKSPVTGLTDPGTSPGSYVAETTTDIVKYVEVKVDDSALVDAGLRDAEDATMGVTSTTLVNNTYVRRLGYHDGGTTSTPLKKASGPPVVNENIMDLFSVNGQAFDLDRLRYVANKLWKKWQSDVAGSTGWYNKFGYQPTGTMSHEQFLYNVENGKPMFGIVRVVQPVVMVSGDGEVRYDHDYPVNGNEFTGTPVWTSEKPPLAGSPYTGMKPNEMGFYYETSDTCAKTIEVYGMLLYDYVSNASYTPNDFDTDQDYVDNSSAGSNNVILPRSAGKNVYMKVFESILVNPVNDKLMGDHSTAGRDFRMDSLERARAYMIADSGADGNKATMDATNVPDAYVWEYWMRKAAKDTPADRATIVDDLIAQYDPISETFTDTGAGKRRDAFNTTEWPVMSTSDQYHAFFPNGYERGWMIAFDALDLDAAEWNGLPESAVSSIDGDNISVAWPSKANGDTTYDPFTVPSETINEDFYDGDIPFSLSGITDADPVANDIPNMFLKTWEDLPSLSFAGGVLDMHGHANISGMLYTPDSGEIETKGAKDAPFQYVNGAMLIGNGIWLEDGSTNDYSMIAVVFNGDTFDQLRSAAQVIIKKPEQIRDLMGQ